MKNKSLNKCKTNKNRRIQRGLHTLMPVQSETSLCQFSIVERGAIIKKGPGIFCETRKYSRSDIVCNNFVIKLSTNNYSSSILVLFSPTPFHQPIKSFFFDASKKQAIKTLPVKIMNKMHCSPLPTHAQLNKPFENPLAVFHPEKAGDPYPC